MSEQKHWGEKVLALLREMPPPSLGPLFDGAPATSAEPKSLASVALGAQPVLPGLPVVTVADLLARQFDMPLRSRKPQLPLPAGGLFRS